MTAPGTTADFVLQYFAPSYGIPEDPATGANHCILAPFWAGRLGKRRLVAHQASARGGDMICTVSDTRVALTGEAHLYLQGTIFVPDVENRTFPL